MTTARQSAIRPSSIVPRPNRRDIVTGAHAYPSDITRKGMLHGKVLRPAGYRTYAVGKWHVTKGVKPDGPKDNWPLARGFDRFYGTLVGAGSYYDPGTPGKPAFPSERASLAIAALREQVALVTFRAAKANALAAASVPVPPLPAGVVTKH